MTELRHLQNVILSIMKDMDKLCQENGIEYYLLGGSAIGAIRHKGFIPWDDDLDIIMSHDNYDKFIEVCKTKLDTNKYYLQEGGKDWPLCFSKIKLHGTRLEEYEGSCIPEDRRGIYIDVFKMDNVSNNPIIARWQYLCGKYYLCYQLATRTYKSANFKKRLMMMLSYPLRLKFLRNLIIKQTVMYNNKKTDYRGFFYGRTRLNNTIVKKQIFGKPRYVPFEDTMLPVAENYHDYLTQMFGDYMKLPPIEQQKGLHLISIDFGNY